MMKAADVSLTFIHLLIIDGAFVTLVLSHYGVLDCYHFELECFAHLLLLPENYTAIFRPEINTIGHARVVVMKKMTKYAQINKQKFSFKLYCIISKFGQLNRLKPQQIDKKTPSYSLSL